MNDQRFQDLAIKRIHRRTTPAEEAELDSLMAVNPALAEEFGKLKAEAALAGEILPLLKAMEATTPALPDYALGRLQTKVRETLRPPEPPSQRASPKGGFPMDWAAAVPIRAMACQRPPEPPSQRASPKGGFPILGWVFALGGVAALAVFLLWPSPPATNQAKQINTSGTIVTLLGGSGSIGKQKPVGEGPSVAALNITNIQLPEQIIQLAMVDAGGVTRGAEGNDANAAFHQIWTNATVQLFNSGAQLLPWMEDWSATNKAPLFKVIYDREGGQLLVKGMVLATRIEKMFQVTNEPALGRALIEAQSFIATNVAAGPKTR